VPGLDAVPYHTSDTIMRLDELPASRLIVGGGFVGAEMGHVFAAFGTDVTIVHRGPRLLPREDTQVADRFTELARDRFDVHLEATLSAVEPGPTGIRATVETSGGTLRIDTDVLLLATGRRSNSDLLDVTTAGIEVDDHGHLVTDTTCHTTADDVWALGDVANHFQLKHMANAESRIVAHNLLHPGDPQHLTTQLAPHAVFSEPEVASVGRHTGRGGGRRRRPRRRRPAVLGYGVRLGAGGHDELRQVGRRPGRPPAARRAHHRPAGIDAAATAAAGHDARPDGRPDGPGRPVHPPGPVRGGRADAARPVTTSGT
jgi:hypothetical protein